MISSNVFIDMALVILIHMVIWYLIGSVKKNNGLVDVGWGLGFVFVILVTQFFHQNAVNWVILAMVGLWGLRLGIYLGIRNWSKPEDWRYVEMRQSWGKGTWWIAFFRVYMLQGAIMYLMCIGFSQNLGTKFNWIVGLGFVIWLMGFLWEAIADYQLYKFKSDERNKGKIITTGLWKFSRHPNYFGEIVLWWGVVISVIGSGGSLLISIIAGLIITFLLNRVSGVPMLESKMKKYGDYKEYIQNTNALIPRFK